MTARQLQILRQQLGAASWQSSLVTLNQKKVAIKTIFQSQDYDSMAPAFVKM